MISLALSYPPTANNLFINQGKGRAKSPGYRHWLDLAMREIMAQRPAKLSGAYVMTITAQRPDNRRRDVCNLEKPISDVLVKMGVVRDDSDAQRVTLQWSPDAPSKAARVHVQIEAYNAL